MQRPTVAIVAHDIHDCGGMERAFFELILGARNRYRFVVFARELAPELRSFVEWKHIPVPPRPMALKFVLFFLIAGWRLSRANAQIVHTMGALVPNRADLACVQFCHAAFNEVASRDALGRRPLVRRINTAVARALGLATERWWYGGGRARVLAAVSPGVKRELERHYPGVPVAITPNGVDVAGLEPQPNLRRSVRREQGADRDDVVALFVGGDWERKGLAIAIESLSVALKLGAPPLCLWVVGRGDVGRFLDLAKRCGVEHRVTFFGPKPRAETDRLYQGADIFVLPTLYETFSLVAYEAAASALPVVATRVNGIEDLVGDDEAGILIERNPEKLGAVLARLATEPGERYRMGHSGRRRAQAYSWARSVQSVVRLYDRAANGSAVEAAPR